MTRVPRWLPAGVVWREAVAPGADRAELHRAGREQAVRALAGLGARSVAADIGADDRGRPLFPAGVVGSIAHDGGFVAAAAARRGRGTAGLGIDLHRQRPLGAGEAAYIAAGRELDGAARWVGRHAAPHVLFALKEAVFKAFSGFDGRWLEFDAIGIDLAPGGRGRLREPGDREVRLYWRCTGPVVRAAAVLASGPRLSGAR